MEDLSDIFFSVKDIDESLFNVIVEKLKKDNITYDIVDFLSKKDNQNLLES